MVMAALLSFMSLGASAFAQQTDAEWLAQCRSQHDRQARYCEARPISWPAGGPIHVDGRPNGGVQVTGWDQASVTGSARVQAQADTDGEAREIASQIVINTSGGTLRAEGPKGRSWSVSFVLSVPRQSDLEITATNGPIAITGITGHIHAETANGPLALEDLGGDVHAATTNGPVSVALGGRTWQGAGLEVSAQNGPVSVHIPDGYSAQLDMGTRNGPVHVGIPISAQDQYAGSRNTITATIGAGGAPIKAHTVNGPLTIDKR
jgi:DUF4097 and DUF4098 domain-containing protein YvlB